MDKYGIPDIHQVYRDTFRERMAALVDSDPSFLQSLLGYPPSKEAMHTAEALWAWLGSGGEKLREECLLSARERYDALLEEKTRDIPVTVAMVMETSARIEGQTLYRRIQNFMQEISGGCLRIGGYHPDTGQRVLKVAFDQNRPFEDQLQVLDFVPYIVPTETRASRRTKSGLRKVIKVFDYTLSAGACYYVEVLADNSAQFSTSYSEKQMFPDVTACLRYVYDNHPYELKT